MRLSDGARMVTKRGKKERESSRRKTANLDSFDNDESNEPPPVPEEDKINIYDVSKPLEDITLMSTIRVPYGIPRKGSPIDRFESTDRCRRRPPPNFSIDRAVAPPTAAEP